MVLNSGLLTDYRNVIIGIWLLYNYYMHVLDKLFDFSLLRFLHLYNGDNMYFLGSWRIRKHICRLITQIRHLHLLSSALYKNKSKWCLVSQQCPTNFFTQVKCRSAISPIEIFQQGCCWSLRVNVRICPQTNDTYDVFDAFQSLFLVCTS